MLKGDLGISVKQNLIGINKVILGIVSFVKWHIL